MKITIEAPSTEIAELVRLLNNSQGNPPMNILREATGISRFYDPANKPRSSGGGGIDYKRSAVEALLDINSSIARLGALLEDLSVSLGVKVQGSDILPQSGAVDGSGIEIPMEVVKEKLPAADSKPFPGAEEDNHGD